MNGHKIVNQNSIHYMTFTVVGWVDVFSRQVYRDVLIDSMNFCIENKGLSVHAYVIMTNHVHVIWSVKDGNELSAIVRDFKRHTSKEIIKKINEGHEESRSEWMLRLFKYFANYNKNNSMFQLWRRDNRPTELVSPKWLNEKLVYVHLNPVRAGIVDRAEDYTYSSARQYLDYAGLLPIELIRLEFTDGYIDR